MTRAALATLLLLLPAAYSQSINQFKALKFREIGPANMGGRIDDFAVVESNPNTIYAGTASAGVWKTVNSGITWDPIFDDQSLSSIGDVTVAPSEPETVWVGTGESNNRQSSSWGKPSMAARPGPRPSQSTQTPASTTLRWTSTILTPSLLRPISDGAHLSA
ncbi:MAG: hypothetical protein NTW74_22125 [Acidobacteria bacterium]|nr:hypothetical protein [Acidobacteriota bacterium]